MAYGSCRSRRHEKKVFLCLACSITSSKACNCSFSFSYHWFLLKTKSKQIPPSSEISCLCINCNIFFLNLINDWDPDGVYFLLFVLTVQLLLAHCLSLNTHTVVSEFMSVKFGFPFPLFPQPDLENCGNAGVPILFSCLRVVVGWDMWRGSMWLVFHVKLSNWVRAIERKGFIKDNLEKLSNTLVISAKLTSLILDEFDHCEWSAILIVSLYYIGL